jgi:hypothetical protein
MIRDTPTASNKDEWVWEHYLSSDEEDTNNHYHYDKELKKITLDQSIIEKEAKDADAIFLKEKYLRDKEIQSLMQEQSVLEATISKIKESNYVNEPQSLVQQELSEAEL